MECCTFSYEDSSVHPETLWTNHTFEGILADLLKDVDTYSRLLNQVVSSKQEAVAILLHHSDPLKIPGRNLDFCIEIQFIITFQCRKMLKVYLLTNPAIRQNLKRTITKIMQEIRHSAELDSQTETASERNRNSLLQSKTSNFSPKDRYYIFGEHAGIINENLIGQASRVVYSPLILAQDLG